MALFRGHQDSVYNLCWQVLRHTHDAEDAAQKVFCELLPVLPTLPNADRFRAWLYRASLLTALNLKRSHKRRMNHERQPRPEAPSTLSASDIEAIHEHLANLRDDLRTLIVRHYFERRTLEELAQSDGCSSVAIWKRLQKAHEELRRSLIRAGLASLAAGIVAFLETRETIAAPTDLLSTALLGAPVALAARAARVKLVAGYVLVAIGGAALLTLGALSRRTEVVGGPPQTAKVASAVPTAEAPRLLGPATSSTAPDPPREYTRTFHSGKAFWAAFSRAVGLRDDEMRWRAFRRLGIRRSDQELAQAWANARAWKIQREWPFKVLSKVFEDWLISSSTEVAAFALGVPFDFSTNFTLVQTLGPAAEAWGETDPGAATAFLKRIPREYAVSELAQGIELRARFKSDPDAYLTWLKALPANHLDLYEATKVAAADWATRDACGAVAWIDHQQAALRETALRSIETAWASTGSWNQNCIEALEAAKDIALAAKSLSERFLLGVAEVDPTWSSEKGEQWESLVFRPLVFSAIRRRVEDDPLGAARKLEDLPFDSWTLEAVNAVALVWAQSDPPAALDWLKRQPFKSIHEHEMCAVIGSWASTDPVAALRATEMLSEPMRTMAETSVVEVWGQMDPAAAAQATLSFPTPMPDPVLGRLAGSWAQQDVGAALAWARGLPRPQARELAFGCIATGIIDDPERALAIAGEITNAEDRRPIVDRIITNTADGDPKAAVELLRAHPDSFAGARQEIARQFAFLDPAGGLAWADTLPLDLRIETQRGILLQAAGRRDMAPVKRWIEQSILPQDVKKEFLKLIRRGEHK